MSNQKKPYVKPEMTIFPAGTLSYNEIVALLKAEETKAKQQEKISPSAKPK